MNKPLVGIAQFTNDVILKNMKFIHAVHKTCTNSYTYVHTYICSTHACTICTVLYKYIYVRICTLCTYACILLCGCFNSLQRHQYENMPSIPQCMSISHQAHLEVVKLPLSMYFQYTPNTMLASTHTYVHTNIHMYVHVYA